MFVSSCTLKWLKRRAGSHWVFGETTDPFSPVAAVPDLARGRTAFALTMKRTDLSHSGCPSVGSASLSVLLASILCQALYAASGPCPERAHTPRWRQIPIRPTELLLIRASCGP